MARYQCSECGQEETGETDCLKHALKYGHKEFYDFETQLCEESDGGATAEIYRPFDDPDILDE